MPIHTPVRLLARSTVLCAAAALVAACDSSRAPGGRRAHFVLPDSAVRVDISTPDRALRTYWRLRDLQDTLHWPVDSSRAEVRQYLRLEEGLLQVFGGTALAQLDAVKGIKPGYAREIIEARQETESRAVVLARMRNVTPIPEGAVPTEREIEARQEGELFRHIFERDQQGWKMVQIQRNWGSEGSEDWNGMFTGEVYVPSQPAP